MTDFLHNENLEPVEVRSDVVSVPSDFKDANEVAPDIMVNRQAPGLFLFDIDGTLIDAKKLHGRAVVDLYKKTFNDPRLDGEEFQTKFTNSYFASWGKGEKEEQKDLLTEFAFPFTDEVLDKLVFEYGETFADILSKATKEEKEAIVLPGVKNFLENLHRANIPMAVVTGNVKQSAEAIIKHLNLAKYFITGGFDDDVTGNPDPNLRRNYILESALNKLKSKGLEFPSEKRMVIGDTPKDFHAATEGNKKTAKVLLVSTGFYSLEELDKVNANVLRPDLVLPSLHLTGKPEIDFELINRLQKR